MFHRKALSAALLLACPCLLSAQSSVLATGSWYRVAVSEDGVYALTFQDLQQLGIDPTGIDPQHLRLFSHGAGMLPEENAVPHPNDLPELNILVEGE
ncbi:MAG: hypothetical protein AAGB22_08290, partial [Bacteroidota bacterium]